MTNLTDSGTKLYRALGSGDILVIRQLLSPDFQGTLSEGLPNGWGRTYHGLDSMIKDGWGRIGETFAMIPVVDQLIDGGDVLIGQGHYVGTAKSNGNSIKAAFAHFWSFNGQQFTAVIQVTDTGKWRDALVIQTD